ncbi:hypothetical protein [Alteribacter natronophilus]|uniref:hypothetical protein n=1 Tax=Alteribacter natronophilus TaxID=2583810 RepID=UPI00110F14AF|nr:hypothetical protein [Alteribacter natronophilus]TMW72274.1 hypothetical protein FGB90_08670 [Alteribacter natronophilus]
MWTFFRQLFLLRKQESWAVGKESVQVYDYVDEREPVLASMYEKRLKGYRALGYKECGEESGAEQLMLF